MHSSFFVQNIPGKCHREQLLAVFGQFGPVAASSILFANRNCAFVDFAKPIHIDPEAAIRVLGTDLLVSKMDIPLAAPPYALASPPPVMSSSPSTMMTTSSDEPEKQRARVRGKSKIPTPVRIENVPDCVSERDIYYALRAVGKISKLQWEHGEYVRFAFDNKVPVAALLQCKEKLDFNLVQCEREDNVVVVGPLPEECNISEVCAILAGFGNLVRMTKIPLPKTTAMRSCMVVFDDVNAAKRVCKLGLVVNAQHLTLNLV